MPQLQLSRALRAVLPVSAAVLCCTALGRDAVPPPEKAPEPPLPSLPLSRCADLPDAAPAWLPGSSADELALEDVPVSGTLGERAAFWERVWGDLSERHTLIVDRRAPWLVWAEADCADVGATYDVVCGERVAIAVRNARARLRGAGDDVVAVYPAAADRAAAASRLMGVRGRREPLERAMRRARAELPAVEDIFRAHGVPPALAKAAIVESLWRPEAESRAGAVGTFQFTAATGKVYLRVDEHVDERKDTVRAAVAAATYLAALHRTFGDWSLALTAYNTGPGRLKKVMRARRATDLGELAAAGDLMGFGFDGQNYAAQVSAVVAVTAFEPLAARDVGVAAVTVSRPRTLATAAACLDVDPSALAAANPALQAPVIRGAALLPKGYVLRVPAVALASARVAGVRAVSNVGDVSAL